MERAAAAALALVASLVWMGGTPSAGAAPDHEEMEWREVFSPDGSIERALVPRQVDPPLDPGTVRRAATAEVVPLQVTGASSERFDLVFVGDGYTAGELELFHQHAASKWEQVAAEEPFATYRDLFNVWMVDVVSNESGVDNDPIPGVLRDTAMDMHFWCSGLDRLLCADVNKAQAFAAAAPEVDQIMALANSTTYGGAGYTDVDMATTSGGNAQAGEIAIHEFGHSIGNLVDEYFDLIAPWPGGEPVQPNASTFTAAEMAAGNLKWHVYLGQPTPDGGVISTFEGANRYAIGIYRPSDFSIMRVLGQPFNLVGLDAMDQAIRAEVEVTGCTDRGTNVTGALAEGTRAVHPTDGFQTSTITQQQACLHGSIAADFDLELQIRRGRRWVTVAGAEDVGADERLSSSAPPGHYRFVVTSVDGAGWYSLDYGAP